MQRRHSIKALMKRKMPNDCSLKQPGLPGRSHEARSFYNAILRVDQTSSLLGLRSNPNFRSMWFLTVQFTTRLHKFPRLGPFGTSSERLLPPLTTSLPAYLKVSLISPTHQLRSVITDQ